MGRRNEGLDNRKSRKQLKAQKSSGNFKRITKKDLSRPPNLTQFKSKMVDGLKGKKNDRSSVIEQLQSESKIEMEQLLNREQPIEPIKEDSEQEIIESMPSSETSKYFREIKKLIEACDIILEILDVRDPLSCRCKELEKRISAMGDKKLILVLNKADLVPPQNAYAWQNYLRRQHPVVIFKANMQKQSTHLSAVTLFKKSYVSGTDMADTILSSNKAIGTDHLLQLIKQLSRVEGTTRAVTVGLVGYPNVGKSSVINSLKRSKTCEVSSMPGCTKNLKEIRLDKQVNLIDCPGVIFQKDLTKNQVVLQNTAKYGHDLEPVIAAILQKIPMETLCSTYDIAPFNSVTDFLAKLCRAFGKLGKGGIPEMKQGAKIVVQDWNRGKLRYFTIPPQIVEQMILE